MQSGFLCGWQQCQLSHAIHHTRTTLHIIPGFPNSTKSIITFIPSPNCIMLMYSSVNQDKQDILFLEILAFFLTKKAKTRQKRQNAMDFVMCQNFLEY